MCVFICKEAKSGSYVLSLRIFLGHRRYDDAKCCVLYLVTVAILKFVSVCIIH